MELRRSLKPKLSMVGLRGDGGERLVEEKPQMGSSFLKPNSSLLAPLSLSGTKRFLHLLFVAMFSLSYQNHHVNRRPVLETCCEEINVKSFVKLQFCLEEVREIERTRLDVLIILVFNIDYFKYFDNLGQFCRF